MIAKLKSYHIFFPLLCYCTVHS